MWLAASRKKSGSLSSVVTAVRAAVSDSYFDSRRVVLMNGNGHARTKIFAILSAGGKAGLWIWRIASAQR
jgi:hypothetical protein